MKVVQGFENISQFILNFTKYPVSELFGSIDSPDSKQKKAEKRITDICEELYRFDCTVLSDVRTAYRDFEVAIIMSDGAHEIKQVHMVKVAGALAYYLDKAIVMLDNMHKKDQLLIQYWKLRSAKSKVLKDQLKSFLIQYYTNTEKAILMSEFDNAYKETEEKDK